VTLLAGDVYYVNLDPTRGTEQKGMRPAVIISAGSLGPRVIVVPLTTSLRGWPTRISLTLHGIRSEAMCDQVRAIDMVRLHEDLYGRVDAATLREIQRRVAQLIDVYR